MSQKAAAVVSGVGGMLDTVLGTEADSMKTTVLQKTWPIYTQSNGLQDDGLRIYKDVICFCLSIAMSICAKGNKFTGERLEVYQSSAADQAEKGLDHHGHAAAYP